MASAFASMTRARGGARIVTRGFAWVLGSASMTTTRAEARGASVTSAATPHRGI